MQLRKNQYLKNGLLSVLMIVSSIKIGSNNFTTITELIEEVGLRDQTVMILITFGVCINFIIGTLINYNIYKVIYRLSNISIKGYELYCDIVTSGFVSNLLILITHFQATSNVSMYLMNSLSNFIFIGLTLFRNNDSRIRSLIKLTALQLCFALLINLPALFTDLSL